MCVLMTAELGVDHVCADDCRAVCGPCVCCVWTVCVSMIVESCMNHVCVHDCRVVRGPCVCCAWTVCVLMTTELCRTMCVLVTASPQSDGMIFSFRVLRAI